ncbi:hypothetical protein HPB50_022972 [Hyalomma asiaticum]|uniref:Uncharacterized protein n=1 Tax=Hyalomma asiaticum TaxID=266040 RepID=A0ACB7TM13_HYAAI|nr:hypothetical protein HPB50_022972 [Hyalomma asiaticum]
MPFSKLKGERPNGMGNSSFDIGICVSRCTEGGRAPGFRGRILRVTGTSRVGGLQVGRDLCWDFFLSSTEGQVEFRGYVGVIIADVILVAHPLEHTTRRRYT